MIIELILIIIKKFLLTFIFLFFCLLIYKKKSGQKLIANTKKLKNLILYFIKVYILKISDLQLDFYYFNNKFNNISLNIM